MFFHATQVPAALQVIGRKVNFLAEPNKELPGKWKAVEVQEAS